MSEHTRTAIDTRFEWGAGPVAACDSRSSQPHAHAVATIHIIARCSCGAAYMSTDGGIALGMARDHEARSGSEEADRG